MQSLSERTAGFTDSVIRRMTRISNQYGAVNLFSLGLMERGEALISIAHPKFRDQLQNEFDAYWRAMKG